MNRNENKEIEKLKQSIEENKKGFELLKKTKKPNKFNNPPKKISDLNDIWNGEELNRVRSLHSQNKIEDLAVCKNCTYKNSYNWKKI
jgi:hypothetical protein